MSFVYWFPLPFPRLDSLKPNLSFVGSRYLELTVVGKVRGDRSGVERPDP